MKGLVKDNNMSFMSADIQWGEEWDEPGIPKWAMFNKEGNITLYAIDNDFTLVEFDASIIPEDYDYGKYFFIDGAFVENPDWVPPLPPIEEQVKELAEDIATVDENTAQVAADLDFIAMELGIDLDQ